MKKSEVLGSLGVYTVEETDDGTQTIHSPAFNENCHSLAGAYEETVYNYVSGTEVLEKWSKQDELSILEIGFGTGLGFKATIQNIKKTQKEIPKKLFFISTEIDELLTLHFLNTLLDENLISSFEVLQEGKLKSCKAEFEYKNTDSGLIYLRGELRVLIGNARETILELQKSKKFQKIDCFYHDPFSPKKNPILWTTEFFKVLSEIAKQESVLSTYSSTKAVWKSLIEAGWRVKEVKGYGKKKLSTRAYLTGESSSFVLEQCKRSPTPALSDSGLPQGLNPLL